MICQSMPGAGVQGEGMHVSEAVSTPGSPRLRATLLQFSYSQRGGEQGASTLAQDILCARPRAQRKHRGCRAFSPCGFLAAPCSLTPWLLHKPFPKPGIVLPPPLFIYLTHFVSQALSSFICSCVQSFIQPTHTMCQAVPGIWDPEVNKTHSAGSRGGVSQGNSFIHTHTYSDNLS